MAKLCRNCDSPTSNPRFCSIHCSAIYNNKKRAGSGRKPCAAGCGAVIRSRSNTCRSCRLNITKTDPLTTLGDLKAKRHYQAHSRIRELARTLYRRSQKPQHCVVCGYDRKFDVCHKRAIGSFPNTTPISVINDIDNLVALCKNHHDEFDDGVFVLNGSEDGLEEPRMLLQLNPPLPLETPKGKGLAHLVIDYGVETDLVWVVFIDQTRECWAFRNQEIKIQPNITFGRSKEPHESK